MNTMRLRVANKLIRNMGGFELNDIATIEKSIYNWSIKQAKLETCPPLVGELSLL